MSNREVVIQAVRELPDDVSFEEIIKQITLLAAIRRGEEAANSGRVIPHEEIRTRMAQWISN